MRDIAERLDEALAGRRAPDAETAPLLAGLKALAPLEDVPERSPDAARAGLQAFLSQAEALRTVSPRPAARPTGWKLIFSRKELSPMNVMLIVALVASLAFGGAGATAYAAQGSLPNEPLYGVKLLTEDLRLDLAREPERQLALTLELAQTRATEMLRLADAGQPVPATVASRLHHHLERALHLAAGFDDAQLAGALVQVQQLAQTQLQNLAPVRLGAPEDAGLRLAEQSLAQTRALAQLGQADPAQFRIRVRAGQLTPTESPAPTQNQPGDGAGYGPGPRNPAATPAGDQNRYGPGPNPTQPVGDGAGYGPGPSAGTPVQGGAGYGPGPGATPSVGDGAGYGPGPGPDVTGTCTPAADGSGPGPGPANPEATPAGDQNHYGPGPNPTAAPQDGLGGNGEPGPNGNGEGNSPGNGGGRP